VVAIVAATIRYLRGTLLYERWNKPPVRAAEEERERQGAATPSVPAGTDDVGEQAR
jgi:hypothetical protein